MENKEASWRAPSRLETVLICQRIYSKQRKYLAIFTPVWDDALFIPSGRMGGFMKVIFFLQCFTCLYQI